jgi:GT2 family glycosyltransferase
LWRRPLRLLEIGVQNGGSLQIWSKYLPPGSDIVGIDIDPQPAKIPFPPNVRVLTGDAADPINLTNLIGDQQTFDLIVDDGSHHQRDIIAAFDALMPRLAAGGKYIVEDLHTSYFPDYGGGFRGSGTAIEFFKRLIEGLNLDHLGQALPEAERALLARVNHEICAISFYDSVVVLEKLPVAREAPFARVIAGREAKVTGAELFLPLLKPDPAGFVAFATSTTLIADTAVAAARLTAAEHEVNAAAARAELSRSRSELEALSEAKTEAETAVARIQVELTAAQARIAQHNALIRRLNADADSLHQQVAAADGRAAELQQRLNAIEQSTSWRASASLRRTVERLPAPLRRHLRRAAKLGFWAMTPHRMPARLQFLRERAAPDAAPTDPIAERLADIRADVKADPIAERLADIRADVKARLRAVSALPAQLRTAPERPLISIILPVFRPPLPLVEKTIASVLHQNYPHWEMCIVDDGSQRPHLADRLRQFTASDSRIKLRLSERNAGIAAASKIALQMATGSYVAFLDHDDLLTCDALQWIATALIEDRTVDLIYSDECKVDEQDEPHDIFCKPDWSPSLLFNCMYIGHLAVYRRSLVAELGGLRSQFAFSQDYDLALRVSEAAGTVRHIDRILYCWRITPQSAAAGGKPYARRSNIAALQDALARRGYDAEAVALPVANWARWQRTALHGRVSIVIPSDEPGHIVKCVQSIRDNTNYPDYEMLIVTRSGIAGELTRLAHGGVRFVSYDKPFNFSDKCNAGAAAADGEYVVFFNDDVRVLSRDWIEALLEALQIDGVAAVAPKLLYENGTIQHAGLISGVRGLVGTAFHCLPADTPSHFNFAQSLRETAAVSGACLAMRRELFRAVGQFDAVHTPINHSDIDLCFRLREQGGRCIYTPYATLRHIGHQSLAAHDEQASVPRRRRGKDKADIFLLRRWPQMTAYDPYFPPAMRAVLYADSPEEYAIHPGVTKPDATGLDILILSHDLSNSGAPRLVFDMACALSDAGHFVVIMSPLDGAYRESLTAKGITVIIDALLLREHHRFLLFARNFDRVIANTVVTQPAVRQLSQVVDVYWYIHESGYIGDQLAARADFAQALHQPKGVWAASKRARRFIGSLRQNVELLEYGVAPALAEHGRLGGEHPAMIVVIGSYEPRKGQDIAIGGIALLPDSIRRTCRFAFFGRVLDPEFHASLRTLADGMMEVYLGPELTHDRCLEVIQKADVVLCPSRDDTLPLVTLDALAAGTILMCTSETGTSEYLQHMQSFVRIEEVTPEAVCAAVTALFSARAEWPEIARRGQQALRQQFSPDMFTDRLVRYLELPDHQFAEEACRGGSGFPRR